MSPQGDEYRCFSHEELSDSDSLSDDGNCEGSLVTAGSRGIVNPNYPGFQHLAHQLHPSDSEDTEEEGDTSSNNNYNNNNNNNNEEEDSDNAVESKIDSVNHLDSVENFQKAFYDKPKFNIPVEPDCCCADTHGGVPDVEKDLNVIVPKTEKIVIEDSEKLASNSDSGVDSDSNNMAATALVGNNVVTPSVSESQQINPNKMTDAFLSGAKEDLLAKGVTDEDNIKSKCEDKDAMKGVGRCADKIGDSNRVVEEWKEEEEKSVEKFTKEEQTASEKEKDEDSVVPRKKEKMEINYNMKKSRSNSCSSNIEHESEQQGAGVVRRREFGPRASRDQMLANRRSVPAAKRSSTEILGMSNTYLCIKGLV